MIIEGKYFDEILRKLYSELSDSPDTFQAGKGKGFDLLAPTIILKDPRARISATATRGRLISALAEFCWYMSGSAELDFIRFYIRDYPPKDATGSLEEAYGPRLLGTGQFGRSYNQIDRVIDRLRDKPDTRRAAICLLEPSDLEPDRSEAPCTSTLQFIRRRSRLHMIAMMRSNDAYMGFTHDVFCFTMLQEYIARSLDLQIGEYHHFATSLHLYESDVKKVAAYFAEGFQSPIFSMPKMPTGCQRENLDAFLRVERLIRGGVISSSDQIDLPVYWRDLAIVLLRHADAKFERGFRALETNFAAISDNFYKGFFTKKPRIISTAVSAAAAPSQTSLDLGEAQ